jgi:SPP1 family predicted phage head-tail adaptor
LSWVTLATVWANVRALGAREQLQSQAVGSDANYTVTVRYRADITPSMRLSWTTYLGSAKTLQILGVQPLDGRREFLALTCGEVV